MNKKILREFLVFCSASQAENPMQDGNALDCGLWPGGEHGFQRAIANLHSLGWSCALGHWDQ